MSSIISRELFGVFRKDGNSQTGHSVAFFPDIVWVFFLDLPDLLMHRQFQIDPQVNHNLMVTNADSHPHAIAYHVGIVFIAYPNRCVDLLHVSLLTGDVPSYLYRHSTRWA